MAILMKFCQRSIELERGTNKAAILTNLANSARMAIFTKSSLFSKNGKFDEISPKNDSARDRGTDEQSGDFDESGLYKIHLLRLITVKLTINNRKIQDK